MAKLSSIGELSPRLENKADFMSYYQAAYGARWNQKLSQDLQPFLPLGKNGQPQSIRNIERRHQARLGRGVPGTTKATAAQYQALADALGPLPPLHGYSITWHGEILISGECVPRAFGPLLITGEAAKQLAATQDIFIILRAYFQGQDVAGGTCGQPDIDIQAADEDQTQMIFQHGPTGGGGGGAGKFSGLFKRGE